MHCHLIGLLCSRWVFIPGDTKWTTNLIQIPKLLHTQEYIRSTQNYDGRWSTMTMTTSSTMVKSASPEPWLPWQYLVRSCNSTNPNRFRRSLTRAVWQGFARNYLFIAGLIIYYTYHAESSDHATSKEWWSRWPQTMALAAATSQTVSKCNNKQYYNSVLIEIYYLLSFIYFLVVCMQKNEPSSSNRITLERGHFDGLALMRLQPPFCH